MITVTAAVCLLPAVNWSWPVAASSDVRRRVEARAVCNNGTVCLYYVRRYDYNPGGWCTSPDGHERRYASGGGVRNSNQFTMTGGMIGPPVIRMMQALYTILPQRVTLTISGNAKIYTDVTNVGILNADDGGENVRHNDERYQQVRHRHDHRQ